MKSIYLLKLGYLIILLLTQKNVFSQNCDSSYFVNAFKSYIEYKPKLKDCDTLLVIKSLLSLKNSYDKTDFITIFLKNENKQSTTILKRDDGNAERTKRFAVLFYIHSVLICNDARKRTSVYIKHADSLIYEDYYHSTLQNISNIENAKKCLLENKLNDNLIDSYYKIVEDYIKNCKRLNNSEARKIYFDELKKADIVWKYSLNDKLSGFERR